MSQILQRHAFEWRRAREAIDRALALGPDNAEALLDACTMAQICGDLPRAIELGQRAVMLDPVNTDSRLFLAAAYCFAGRLREAKAEVSRMIELDSRAHAAHMFACMIHLAEGDASAALEHAKQEPARMHQLEALALAEFALGNITASDTAVLAMEAEFADGCPWQIAEVCAYRGEPDRAFRWLERAWQVRDPGLGWLKVAMLVRSLHHDPRWPVFMEKVGLTDEQLK